MDTATQAYGWLLDLATYTVGSALVAPAAAGDTTLAVLDASMFDTDGGELLIAGGVLEYLSADPEADIIVLAAPLDPAYVADEDDTVTLWDSDNDRAAVEQIAYVEFSNSDGDDDPVPATLATGVSGRLPTGSRGGRGETVLLEKYETSWRVIDVVGQDLIAFETDPEPGVGIKFSNSWLRGWNGIDDDPTFDLDAVTGDVRIRGALFTGGSIYGAQFVTSDDDTGQRVVIRNDGSGGVIEFFTGEAAETAAVIDPGLEPGDLPTMYLQSGTLPGKTRTARIRISTGLGSGALEGTVDVDAATTRINGNATVADDLAIYGSSSGADHVWFPNGYANLVAGIETRLKTAALFLGSPSAIVTVGSGGELHGQDVYVDQFSTTSNAANVFMTGGGRLQRVTSSKRYKSHVKALSVNVDRLLALEPKTFRSKHPSEKGQRQVGFIAEDAADLGLEDWVEVADGVVEAFDYGKWVVALQAIARHHADQLDELRGVLRDTVPSASRLLP